MLGENVLPVGIGHTTSCFVEVRGSAKEDPCLMVSVVPKDEEEEDEEEFVEMELGSVPSISFAKKDRL